MKKVLFNLEKNVVNSKIKLFNIINKLKKEKNYFWSWGSIESIHTN